MSNRSISDSAFLVNESRSRRVDISKDIYAYLWINASTKKLWNDFSTEVYPFDDIQLSLRNRFFLDELDLFINKSDQSIFVNIGSGFTTYPFLVSKECKFIEVDLPKIINYKKEKIKQFINNGKLPKRDIIFISADICNNTDLIKLKEYLIKSIKNIPSFILLEGITYFLNRQYLNQLLNILSEIQKSNSILAFDFWKTKDSDHPVLKKLMRFFSDRFGFENRYNLLDINFTQNLKGYKLIELYDIQELEKKYTKESFLSNYNKIIPEYYIILKVSQS